MIKTLFDIEKNGYFYWVSQYPAKAINGLSTWDKQSVSISIEIDTITSSKRIKLSLYSLTPLSIFYKSEHGDPALMD